MTTIWSRRPRRRRRYTPKHQASRPRGSRGSRSASASSRVSASVSPSSVLTAVGGVVFLAALGGVLFLQAWPPLAVVRSGSMAPAIDVGDVVVMRSLGGRAPQVGDVVQVTVPAKAQRDFSYPPSVTHRIIEIDDGIVRTKGDGLADADPFTVSSSSIRTRVILVVPYVGRAAAFATSPLGLLWLGIGAALFFLAPLHDLRRQPLVVVPPPLPPAVPPTVAPLPAVDEIVEMRETVRDLVSAVGHYGEHLRSHTAVVEEMSHASRDLAKVAASLEQVVNAPPPAPPPAPPAPPHPPASAWRGLVTLRETRNTLATVSGDLRRVLRRGRS